MFRLAAVLSLALALAASLLSGTELQVSAAVPPNDVPKPMVHAKTSQSVTLKWADLPGKDHLIWNLIMNQVSVFSGVQHMYHQVGLAPDSCYSFQLAYYWNGQWSQFSRPVNVSTAAAGGDVDPFAIDAELSQLRSIIERRAAAPVTETAVCEMAQILNPQYVAGSAGAVEYIGSLGPLARAGVQASNLNCLLSQCARASASTQAIVSGRAGYLRLRSADGVFEQVYAQIPPAANYIKFNGAGSLEQHAVELVGCRAHNMTAATAETLSYLPGRTAPDADAVRGLRRSCIEVNCTTTLVPLFLCEPTDSAFGADDLQAWKHTINRASHVQHTIQKYEICAKVQAVKAVVDRKLQLYVQAGNVMLPRITWQLGTLDTWMGDLGLYDARPSTLFDDTLGLSARYRQGMVDAVVAFGDAGFFLHGAQYNTVLSTGANVRIQPVKGFEFGVGGQFRYEPKVVGNRHAPYTTPGLDYEDWFRGEAVLEWEKDHPGQAQDFPGPQPTDATSYRVVGYVGFGGGPVQWNSTYVTYQKLHPQKTSTEVFQDEEYTLYPTALTDERTQLFVGNELMLGLVPGKLDLVWGALYGAHWDKDNDIAPSDFDRWYASTVVRTQAYLTPTVHLLVETSLAYETSRNGNAYRDHVDSVFQNTGGTADSRGLENGDNDTRTTWQGKGGLVLNPLGPGVYVRPSLRLMYGVQWSTQNNAFGNSFVETLDQYNDFGNAERHWHHVLAIEAEVWF